MKKQIRFAIAQMNPSVGDYPANFKQISTWIRQAEKKGADLIVFPELALHGYPVWDLANKKSFIDEGQVYFDRVVRLTKDKHVNVVIGFIDQDKKTYKSRNTLAWISKGKVKGLQHKRLLPTYDVFLEQMFFRPGTKSKIIPWKGFKVAPTICEDIWDLSYERKPLEDLAEQGANFSVNISASPFYQGAEQKRDQVVRTHCVRYKMPMLYVNQVGAQDDLIFDGRSMFVDQKGRVLFRAPRFEAGLFFYDWQQGKKKPEAIAPPSQASDIQETYEALVLGVKDYFRKNNFKKALLGLSGGIDSALVAVLASEALGPENVMAITMPSHFSSKGSWKDSEVLAKNLGIQFYNHSIAGKYDYLVKAYQAQAKKNGWKAKNKPKVSLAMENLQARLRGVELMYLSNDLGRILLTTGNKSELAVGYCTLYGDMAGGLAVLGDVYKSDVFRLARYCNRHEEVIPNIIITKPPSAELRPDQKDEDSLPPYDVLDEILFLYIEKNLGKQDITRHMKSKKVKASVIADVIRKTDHNEYKRRQTPPILRVTKKAWFGRRMPITNQFDG